MNREILFRGQHRRKGERIWMDGTPVESRWIYGGVCQGEGDFSIIYQTEPDIHKFPVYTDTLGQYTGLTDKNGRKIFEKDILKRGDHKYVVEWCDDCAMFVLPCITDETLESDFTVFYGYDFEVIGNIHDNLELMKGETNV